MKAKRPVKRLILSRIGILRWCAPATIRNPHQTGLRDGTLIARGGSSA
jgi:hypothetical protein